MSKISPQELHSMACEALKFAHSPYSKRKVGAAILLENGKTYTGCNVENASYGGTVCAERVAIFKSVSENSKVKIKAVAVVSDAPASGPPWPPCGLCLQVIAEFAQSDTVVHVGSLKKLEKTFKFKELLPEAFSRQFLNE